MAFFGQGLKHGEQGGRTEEPGEGVVAGVHDLGSGPHGRHDARHVVAVGIVTVIVDDQVRIGVEQRAYQPVDTPGGSETGVVLDGKDDVRSGHVQDLPCLLHVERVRMLGACGETNRGLQILARALDLLEHGHHVGNVIQVIENPPDVHVPCKGLDRQAHHILRIGPVSEQIDSPAQGLKQGPGHSTAQKPQAFKGVDLFAEHVHVHARTACDLQREEPCLVSLLSNKEIRVRKDTVLEIRLRQIPGRVRHKVTACLTQNAESFRRARFRGNSVQHVTSSFSPLGL